MNRTFEVTRKMKDSGVEWIGDIPQDWRMVPLKAILKERKEKNLPIKTTSILSLTIDKGVIPYSEKSGGGNKAKEDLTAYKLAYPNDIVLNSMNVIAGAVGLSKYFGAISPVYYTLYTDEDKNDIRYFNNIFQTQAFQKSLLGLGNGIMIKESNSGKLNTIRLRIPMEKLKSIMLPVPLFHEQQAIATYLDEQVEKIDSLISEQKQAIENWKWYKQSLMTETVTKGLNPDVEMKDSGIEWIGEIPKEWELKKGKYLFKQSMKKGGDHLIQLASTQAYGVVPQSFLENVVKVSLDTDLSKFKEVKINDFVISLRSFQGGFEMAKYNGVITPAYTVFRSTTCIHHNYFKYLFKAPSFISKINSITVGIREGKDIKYNDFSQMILPIPPLYEQQAIADYLDEKCSKIDQTIEQKQQLIKQLEGYKQSLIYECVTGKRCVL